MIRKSIFLLLASFILLPLHGQDEDNEIKTLFGTHHTNGGYGAFSVGYSQINSLNAITMGGRGAWIIGHSLALGFYGSGFATDFRVLTVDRSYNLVGGHGGIFIEPILLPKFPVHLSFPVMAGVGGIAYTINRQPDFTGNFDGYVQSSTVFMLAEPGVELELNLTRWFRLAVGASYRFTSDVRLNNTDVTIPSNVLKGISGGVTLKFGKF